MISPDLRDDNDPEQIEEGTALVPISLKIGQKKIYLSCASTPPPANM
jgi:hypothetical protein